MSFKKVKIDTKDICADSDVSLSLCSLPVEIIEKILLCESLNFNDIFNICLVCKRLNCIGNYNTLWQVKFSEKWPAQRSLYDSHGIDWKKEFICRLHYNTQLAKYLHKRSQELYHKENVCPESFSDMEELCNGHPFTYHILTEELRKIILHPNRFINLTIKYYAEIALRYLVHKYVTTEWEKYLSTPDPSWLRGIYLLSEWYRPVTVWDTSKWYIHINKLIVNIYNSLKSSHPHHPAIAKGIPLLKGNNTVHCPKSHWSPIECKVILRCICDVFKYHDYTLHSTIEKLKEIDGKALFLSIAEQFGVRTNIFRFSNGTCLAWVKDQEGDLIHGITISEDKFEDFSMEKDKLLKKEVSIVKHIDSRCRALISEQEFADHNLREDEVNSIYLLKLQTMLFPNDSEYMMSLAHCYVENKMHLNEAIRILSKLTSENTESIGRLGSLHRAAIISAYENSQSHISPMKPQNRNENTNAVLYRVGMVLKHKRYNYRCVINGWDTTCTASMSWQNTMGVHLLPGKGQQPFYHVLAHDGSKRYVAQENFIRDPYDHFSIKHREVGRHFDSFRTGYYTPNSELAKVYCDDGTFPAPEAPDA